MANWKLGRGANYASIVGFTWPTNYNPDTFEDLVTKLQYIKPIPYQDNPYILDQGTQSVAINVQGTLWTQTDINNLQAAASQSAVNQTGYVQNLIQRLYINGTDYVLVHNGTARSNLFATNPLGYPYIATFIGMDPFIYTDSPVTYSSSSSTTPTVTGIANIGNAYCFPIFTIQNTGGASITAIAITYAGYTLNWNGTLPAGSTLYVYQDFSEAQNDPTSNTYIGTVSAGGIGGVRLAIMANVSGQTVTATLTGATGILSVIVPNRRWA